MKLWETIKSLFTLRSEFDQILEKEAAVQKSVAPLTDVTKADPVAAPKAKAAKKPKAAKPAAAKPAKPAKAPKEPKAPKGPKKPKK
jgi:hypothetical protein